ncbi:MAG: acyltransferase family protein [Stellaceae bacterium]
MARREDHRGNNFDALRLGAALSVLLTHAILIGENRIDTDPLMLATGGQCTAGVAGVFLFFVISGYLVTGSAAATGSTVRFLLKRALRIYPGLAACLLVLALILGPLATALPWSAYFPARGTWDFIVQNLAMNVDVNTLPGVRFTGFAAGRVVDGSLWSLPAELVMYLLVAGLGALNLLRLRVIALMIGLGITADLADTASWHTVFGNALWLMPFFAVGMALWTLRTQPVFTARTAFLALALLALSVPLRLFIPAFALAGGYLAIYLARIGRVHVSAARFGDLSYGLYIYGWPAEQAVTRTLGGAAPWWEVLALALPPTFALAFLSWHLVEAPALRLKTTPYLRRAAALRM